MLFKQSTVVLENEKAYGSRTMRDPGREHTARIGLKEGTAEQNSTKMWEYLTKHVGWFQA